MRVTGVQSTAATGAEVVVGLVCVVMIDGGSDLVGRRTVAKVLGALTVLGTANVGTGTVPGTDVVAEDSAPVGITAGLV